MDLRVTAETAVIDARTVPDLVKAVRGAPEGSRWLIDGELYVKDGGELIKGGRGFPVGTVRRRKGGYFQKVSDSHGGRWVEVRRNAQGKWERTQPKSDYEKRGGVGDVNPDAEGPGDEEHDTDERHRRVVREIPDHILDAEINRRRNERREKKRKQRKKDEESVKESLEKDTFDAAVAIYDEFYGISDREWVTGPSSSAGPREWDDTTTGWSKTKYRHHEEGLDPDTWEQAVPALAGGYGAIGSMVEQILPSDMHRDTARHVVRSLVGHLPSEYKDAGIKRLRRYLAHAMHRRTSALQDGHKWAKERKVRDAEREKEQEKRERKERREKRQKDRKKREEDAAPRRDGGGGDGGFWGKFFGSGGS